jgi:hypothetical protein
MLVRFRGSEVQRFKVQGSRFKVQGSRFKAQGSMLKGSNRFLVLILS